jgi:hypothetical protein
VYDIQCALQVLPGETLDDIVALIDDDTVDVETIMAENGLESPDVEADVLLDVCVDNGLNDIDGTTRTERNAVVAQREVMVQQEKLNELFAAYGIRELLVDGISGPVTRQRLCAFRLGANLPVSTEDMIAGSEEEALLLGAETLGIPAPGRRRTEPRPGAPGGAPVHGGGRHQCQGGCLRRGRLRRLSGLAEGGRRHVHHVQRVVGWPALGVRVCRLPDQRSAGPDQREYAGFSRRTGFAAAFAAGIALPVRLIREIL